MIIDLYNPDGFAAGFDVLCHHRYEPHAVQIYDQYEAEPNLLGDLELYDVETEAVQKVTVTERNLRQYRPIFDDFRQSVRRYCNTYTYGLSRATTL